MARFDIYAVRGGLALDCQADILRRMPTRFVVPIEPFDPALVVSERLNPTFAIREQRVVMVTQLAGTIRAKDLGDLILALTTDADQIAVQGALDMLMTGV